MSVITHGAHLAGASALVNSLQLGAASVASLDPAIALAEGGGSSYAPARGPLFFSQGGGGRNSKTTMELSKILHTVPTINKGLKRLKKNLDDMIEKNEKEKGRPCITLNDLEENFEGWWEWTEKGTELERIAATHLLGRYVTGNDAARRLECVERLVHELYSESAERRIAAFDALNYSIRFLDRDSLVNIGRKMVELGLPEKLLLKSSDGERIEIDVSKYIHGRVSKYLSGMGELSQDHADELIRFYHYIDKSIYQYIKESTGEGDESLGGILVYPALEDEPDVKFLLGNFSAKEWCKAEIDYEIVQEEIATAQEFRPPIQDLLKQKDPYLRLAGYMGLWSIYEKFPMRSNIEPVLWMLWGLRDEDDIVRDYVSEVIDGILNMSEEGAFGLDHDDIWRLANEIMAVIRLADDLFRGVFAGHLVGHISKILTIERHAELMEDLRGYVMGDEDAKVRGCIFGGDSKFKDFEDDVLYRNNPMGPMIDVDMRGRARAVGALLAVAYSRHDPAMFGIDAGTIVRLAGNESAEMRAATLYALEELVARGIDAEEVNEELKEALIVIVRKLEEDQSEIVKESVSRVKQLAPNLDVHDPTP